MRHQACSLFIYYLFIQWRSNFGIFGIQYALARVKNGRTKSSIRLQDTATDVNDFNATIIE